MTLKKEIQANSKKLIAQLILIELIELN
jgi:hypothetical protein